MEIDLYQLPIPDWGLVCPTCSYLLNGLPSHRCPECGTEFDIQDIIPTWARLRDPHLTGLELPFPDLGLLCAQCAEPLAGARRRACPRCREPFDPAAMRPSNEWFVVEPWMRQGVPVEIVGLILEGAHVPYSARERHNAFVNVPPVLSVTSEFYYEFLHLMRQQGQREGRKADEAEAAPWTCPTCGEENVGHFEVCWSCQTQRNGG